MATFDVELTGGAPWGFSMVGGSDFNQPLNISKVISPHNSADYPSWNEFEYSKIFISNIVISLVDLFIEFLRKLNDEALLRVVKTQAVLFFGKNVGKGRIRHATTL